ncbi:hypothetical protein CBR_g30170 [Chara braunii]|uniref:pectinesterase n=1 Tax=Chara braunii TaxID=69332 RepID=A0A388LC50_CHABU|nr:hypothetical protein CBR_g30170 [Chara braunii]|eukprot:GBG79905.1 hypothetical protein CBR_g30170 [Chara braunii]
MAPTRMAGVLLGAFVTAMVAACVCCNAQATAGIGTPGTVTVGPGGQFSTVQAALNQAAPGSRIVILPGIYREKVTVRKAGITMVGVNYSSIIVWDDSAGSAGGTPESATVTVEESAAGFTAVGMTFKNDYGPNERGTNDQQAVALYVLADASIYNCTIDSWQDTLMAHAGRQYYKFCFIAGTVDFAFGAGTVFFEDCVLYAKNRTDSKYATYTAQQRTDPDDRSGFVFMRGHLQCGLNVKALLGRGWGKYARTIFIETLMEDCIRPEGWGVMKSVGATDTTFFAEYNCTGPGSDRSARVAWSRVLTPGEAAYFSNRTSVLG